MARPADWDEVFGISDPTPGEPHSVRSVARRWLQVAETAQHAESRLRNLLGDDAVVTWIGKGGDAFRSHSSDLPDQLRKTSDSYHQAATAMSWWADRLEGHQADAHAALVRGRAAKADLEHAQRMLGSAGSELGYASSASVLHYTGDPAAPHAPTTDQVRAAQRRLAAAQQAQVNAQGLVDDAQARLDAARQLAQQAGQLRERDGHSTADKVHDAADAGIAPRSFWDKLGSALSSAWHVLVTVAKVVVAVLGVVALIIGGPIAWVVFAAALVVLADTLAKWAQGDASLLDVGLALLACIPGTRGLTTFAELSAAFRAGGAIGAAAHLGVALKTTAVSLVRSANALRTGLLPGMRATIAVLGEEGVRVLPRLRTSVRELMSAQAAGEGAGSTIVKEARDWQGALPYPGQDPYAGITLLPTKRLEAGFPGLSNYAMDEGSAAASNYEAAKVWEGVQVGPGAPDGRFPGYRGSLVELEVHTPTEAATGITMKNPQYGGGGTRQYFLHIKEGIAAGDIAVLDHAGQPIHIPAGTTPSQVESVVSQALHGRGTIQLTGAHAPDYTHVMSQDNVKDMVRYRELVRTAAAEAQWRHPR